MANWVMQFFFFFFQHPKDLCIKGLFCMFFKHIQPKAVVRSAKCLRSYRKRWKASSPGNRRVSFDCFYKRHAQNAMNQATDDCDGYEKSGAETKVGSILDWWVIREWEARAERWNNNFGAVYMSPHLRGILSSTWAISRKRPPRLTCIDPTLLDFSPGSSMPITNPLIRL